MTGPIKLFFNSTFLKKADEGSIVWWAKNSIIAMISIFFLVFGIDALINAYSMKNPAEFIMYFFSSNLIILISVVGIIYPALRIYALLKNPKIP